MSYLLLQILITWLIACCILRIFNTAVAIRDTEIYQEPVLLTALLSAIDIKLSLRQELIASRILHHIFGLCFASVYYIIWYYEFEEISWSTSLIIGLTISLVRIVSWTFLLEIIPSARLNCFKGYHLQLIFVHNTFTLSTLLIYQLLS